jgi:hypothetical protein
VSEEKGTSAITGITNFLFLAFIVPGIVYVCFVLVLFPVDSLKKLIPGLGTGADVAVGAVVTLGLVLTSIVFAIDISLRGLFSRWRKGSAKRPKQNDYADILFNEGREKEVGWYFWQLWGQKIMHQNIAGGLLIIYVVYRFANYEIWPPSLSFHLTWRDWTLVVIVANLVCWLMFSRWHADALSRLRKP